MGNYPYTVITGFGGLNCHGSLGGIQVLYSYCTRAFRSSIPQIHNRGCNHVITWPLDLWTMVINPLQPKGVQPCSKMTSQLLRSLSTKCLPACFLAANIGKPTLVSKMYCRINYSTAMLVEFPSTNLLLQVSAHPWLCPWAIRQIKKKPHCKDLSSIPKAQIISCPVVYSRKHLMVCLSWKRVRQMHKYCTIK